VTELPPYRRPVNLMFQSYALFPHLSVFELVNLQEALGITFVTVTHDHI
jgi:ABC-type Fe3+/spermidine/putrescine transport system ATPase subunit